jgi:hypothetical protein
VGASLGFGLSYLVGNVLKKNLEPPSEDLDPKEFENCVKQEK